MINRKDSIQQARDLSLPNIVIEILEEKELPSKLWIYFGCPVEFFLMSEKEQNSFCLGRHLIPLWDDGNFDRITCFDKERNRFLRIYAEFPEEDIDDTYNWEQLMALEFTDLWESEFEEETLLELSVRFAFRSVHELLSVLKTKDYDDGVLDRLIQKLNT